MFRSARARSAVNACATILLLTTTLFLSCKVLAAESDISSGIVEYLYIDANEDQASGGHTAVRIDEDVFHFQYIDGLLQMERDRWADFQLTYRGYQNRNIRAIRLDIDEQTYQALKSTFIRRHITQSAQVSLLKDTQRDVRVVSALLQDPVAAIELPGFGFFQPVQSDKSNNTFRHSLRTKIRDRHGPEFTDQKYKSLIRKLANLPVTSLNVRGDDFNAGTLPHPQYAFSQRYEDSLTALHALEILEGNNELDHSSLTLAIHANEEWTLSAGDRQHLYQVSNELIDRLSDLVASRRPGWGKAMLLGLARLEAMNQSLELDRWIFIDILKDDSNVIELGSRTRELLPNFEQDARLSWLKVRDSWRSTTGWKETAYADFEAASARWLELRRLSNGASNWRIKASTHIPSGLGLVENPPMPDALNIKRNERMEEFGHSLSLAEKYTKESSGYHVIEHNCVTELFTTFNMALENILDEQSISLIPENLKKESVKRFGRSFSPNPIPFVSASQLARHWNISDDQELPSLRRLYVTDQYRKNPGPFVLLRESNTLTSSVYQRSEKDSFFIFFTDGNVAIRPLLGLVNLTAALGASIAGVVQAPFDGGKGLNAGLRGAMFSLPELGFQNIRKGTNSWIAPELRSVQTHQE